MAKNNRSGRIVRPAKNGLTKVIRAPARAGRAARWSDAAEERFLDVLAATCNVTAAAEAAGFSTTALYRRRARWPGFAAEWDAAIAQGYARLEARLVELATDSLRAPDRAEADDRLAAPATPPAMTVAEAMNLLRLHRAAARGGAAQNFAWRRAAPDPEAMRASILRKIEAIERAAAPRPPRETSRESPGAPASAGERG